MEGVTLSIKDEDYSVTSHFDLLDSITIHDDVTNGISTVQDFDLNLLDRKRGRRAFTSQQTQELEKLFQQNHYISATGLEEVSNRLQASPKQVKVWFQNRRVREKSLRNNTTDGATVHGANSNGVIRPSHRILHNKIRLTAANKIGADQGNNQFRMPLQRNSVMVHQAQSKPVMNNDVRRNIKQELCSPFKSHIRKILLSNSQPNVKSNLQSTLQSRLQANKPMQSNLPISPDNTATTPRPLKISHNFHDVDSFFNRIKTLRNLSEDSVSIKKEKEKVTEPFKLHNIPQPIMTCNEKKNVQLEKFHPYLSFSAEMYTQAHHHRHHPCISI